MATPALRLLGAAAHAGAALRLVGDVDAEVEDSGLRYALSDLGWSSRVWSCRG
jgi:hypothetical protein